MQFKTSGSTVRRARRRFFVTNMGGDQPPIPLATADITRITGADLENIDEVTVNGTWRLEWGHRGHETVIVAVGGRNMVRELVEGAFRVQGERSG